MTIFCTDVDKYFLLLNLHNSYEIIPKIQEPKQKYHFIERNSDILITRPSNNDQNSYTKLIQNWPRRKGLNITRYTNWYSFIHFKFVCTIYACKASILSKILLIIKINTEGYNSYINNEFYTFLWKAAIKEYFLNTLGCKVAQVNHGFHSFEGNDVDTRNWFRFYPCEIFRIDLSLLCIRVLPAGKTLKNVWFCPFMSCHFSCVALLASFLHFQQKNRGRSTL